MNKEPIGWATRRDGAIAVAKHALVRSLWSKSEAKKILFSVAEEINYPLAWINDAEKALDLFHNAKE